jgi:lysozyme
MERIKGKQAVNTASNGIALIKYFEHCSLNAFKPIPTDPWTIGWGRAHGISEGQTCTPDEADRMLREDLASTEQAVSASLKVQPTQNQFDAMVSLAYNIGVTAFEDSTLLRLVNIYAKENAALQFARWNKSKGVVLAGLTRRREAERRLFLTPDNQAFEVEA